ncbi:histidine phosphatase family protein [Legionella sp. D16C41]|uniref:histidine phosphatase family protein n=1 Tax=Legionella sp. D16C41 TaxID=3402688 RepID=UPI003AF457E9
MYKTRFLQICLTSCLFLSSFYVLAEEKLILAIDLIRHGDRTPTMEIPKAPYQWQEGLGELTEQGIAQEVNLGKKLRQIYINQFHLLPDNYKPGTLYVRTTNFNRTIASAKAVLLGLYPLSKRGNQTIPIDTVLQTKDDLLLARPSKNILFLAKLFLINQRYWALKTYSIKEKINNWSLETGIKLNNFLALGRLADNLSIRQLHHIALPQGLTEEDAKEITDLATWAMVGYFKLPEVSYPQGLRFIQEVTNYFTQASENKSLLRYILYSAHDSTIMSVMTTLGTPLSERPPYASRLNFLFFNNNNNFYVKISYNDKPLKLPGCKTIACTLTEFKSLALKQLPF